MFKGYVGFGDVEVINVARLMKYVEEGGAPRDLVVDPKVGDYSALATALGDGAYRTALLDSPPWYDETNPDSAGFAGLVPLSIDNLDGSTRSRTVTEGLGPGGRPSRSRAASRVIPVTVLAVGNGDAALDAGLSWLTGALHPPCATGTENCRGAALELFSAAPAVCEGLPDFDATPINIALIGEPVIVPGPSVAYFDLAGNYLRPSCGEVTVTAVVRSDDGIGGRSVVLALVDSTGEVVAQTVAELPDGEDVTVTVAADPSPGFPAEWQPILSWYGPAIIDAGDVDDGIEDVIDGGGSDELPDLIDGGDTDGPWGSGDSYGGDLTISEWTYTRLPELTVADCLADLRRSYRNVVTIDGPTVVEELTLEDGEPYAARVEWTWVATDPIQYGDSDRLVGGLMVGALGSHPAVQYATTENLASFYVPATGPFYVDGVDLNADVVIGPIGSDTGGFNGGSGDAGRVGTRILVRAQTGGTSKQGIYVYNGPGAYLTRAEDMDGAWDTEVVGAQVYVQGGETLKETTWYTTATSGGTLGTTAMPWLSPAPLATDYDNGVGYRAAGIQIASNVEVAGEDTACPTPAPVLVLCGDDPDLPPVIAPPAPPTLADPGMPTVETYVRREFQVPPDLSPQPGGVLTFGIQSLASVAYRGIRVRLWADADPDFGVSDECDWETEFYITYLAPGQTVTIDGPDHTVTTTCVSGIDADHERNMRGPYGGPFVYPELRCGSRYHVAIDVPLAEDGETSGVSVNLSVTRRAG